LLFKPTPGIAREPGKDARGVKMTIRNAVLGMTMMFGLAVWAWCRPCSEHAQAQAAEAAADAETPEGKAAGNHDEAVARYRTNQSRHWKQVVLRK